MDQHDLEKLHNATVSVGFHTCMDFSPRNLTRFSCEDLRMVPLGFHQGVGSGEEEAL